MEDLGCCDRLQCDHASNAQGGRDHDVAVTSKRLSYCLSSAQNGGGGFNMARRGIDGSPFSVTPSTLVFTCPGVLPAARDLAVKSVSQTYLKVRTTGP